MRPPVFLSSRAEYSPGPSECWIGAFISAALGSPSWEPEAAAPCSVSSTLVTVKCGIVTARNVRSPCVRFLPVYLRCLSLPCGAPLWLITAHGRPREGIGKYFQFTWPTALREGNLENPPSKVVFTTHLKGLSIPPIAYLLLNSENHKNGLGCFPREAKGWRVGECLKLCPLCMHPLVSLSYLHIEISTSALTSHRTKTREQFIKDWYYINLESQLSVSFCCCFISKHIENSHASQCFFLSFRWEHSFNKYLMNTYVF